jgi:hypothetical protein
MDCFFPDNIVEVIAGFVFISMEKIENEESAEGYPC